MEENEMGTVHFTIRFFKLSLFINVLFGFVSVALGLFVLPVLLKEEELGLWPILFCDLVIQCYQNPEQPRGLCCLPIQIKAKWYPLILIAIFMLLL